MISWMKYKFVYFAISAIFLIAGTSSLVKWGLNLGIDFTGGVVTEYRLSNGVVETKKFLTASKIEIPQVLAKANPKETFYKLQNKLDARALFRA